MNLSPRTSLISYRFRGGGRGPGERASGVRTLASGRNCGPLIIGGGWRVWILWGMQKKDGPRCWWNLGKELGEFGICGWLIIFHTVKEGWRWRWSYTTEIMIKILVRTLHEVHNNTWRANNECFILGIEKEMNSILSNKEFFGSK